MKCQSDSLHHESESEEAWLNQAAGHCQDQGGKLTPIRRLVLKLLARHSQGIKAYDLMQLMRTMMPNTFPPTVYRALTFLISVGLAHKISCRSTFIASDTGHTPVGGTGLFLVCPRCHSITELQDEATSQALHKALGDAGFKANHSAMEVEAICPSCTKYPHR